MGIYFIILFLLFVWSAYGWHKLESGDETFFSFLGMFIGTIGSIVMIIGTFVPAYNTKYEKFPAKSTNLGSEIIVQSPGLPTQMVSDLKFVDKPLVIVKRTNTNLYGINETSAFGVEIQKLEK